MGASPINYDALAGQHGGTPDYDALASAHGGASDHSEQPGALSRFASSVVSALNPIPGIKEWMDRPKAFADAMHGAAVLHKVRSEKREPTKEEQEAIDRAEAAHTSIPGGDMGIAAPAITSMQQVQQGDVAGAAGTLVGSYGVPAVAPMLPGAAKATAGAAKGVAATALDIASSPGARDLAGIVSPRIAHGLSLLDRVKKTMERLEPAAPPVSKPGAAPVEAPAPTPEPSRIIQARESAPAARGDWRQAIVDELNPPPKNMTVQELAQAPPTAAPAAAPKTIAELSREFNEATGLTTGKVKVKETGVNKFEAKARADKAKTFATFIQSQGPEMMQMVRDPAMGPPQWKMLADAAGIKDPSPATVKLALDMLKMVEMTQ